MWHLCHWFIRDFESAQQFYNRGVEDTPFNWMVTILVAMLAGLPLLLRSTKKKAKTQRDAIVLFVISVCVTAIPPGAAVPTV